MNEPLAQTDVAVVGAGTTGAAAALLCARRGFEVVCVDRSPLERAGARWVNGVPGRCFDQAGIERPKPPELLGGGEDFHLIAGRGSQRVIVREHDLLEVDMRLLVERLHLQARQAGVRFVGNAHVTGVDTHRLQTSRGAIEARWFVDASGLSGAGLLDQPSVEPADICAAAQQVRRVTDPQAARRFYERQEALPGDILCFTGVAGGYSILHVRLDGDQVSLLTGSIPALGHRSGRAILAEFADAQPWIGESVFGGSRGIPLRRPYERLHDKNVALVGDAACQVFAAHGSGVGPGMLAAHLLAEALADGRGVAGYAADWQREYGGLFAGYALFRRFSQTLSESDLTRLMASGLMDETLVRQGLEQQQPSIELQDVAAKLRAVLEAPDLAFRLGPVVGRMLLALLVYAAYPASLDELPPWRQWAHLLVGKPVP